MARKKKRKAPELTGNTKTAPDGDAWWPKLSGMAHNNTSFI